MKMKRFGREPISQKRCRFFSKRVDLILAKPISDRLCWPLRIAKDCSLRRFAARSLVVLCSSRSIAARTWKKIDYLREQINGIVIAHPAGVNSCVYSHAQIAIQLALQLVEPFF